LRIAGSIAGQVPMNDARLANRLRDWRAKKDLTQADLAQLAGVSRKTINTVENGVFVPSVQLALVLARTLGTNVESLFQLVSSREKPGR
jgi:putative transcriptional regulator